MTISSLLITKKETLSLASLTLLVLSLFSMTCILHANTLPADSMWTEPTTSNYSTKTTPLGYKFNMTVWLNVTSPTNAWQFYLIYNKAQLKATRCDYTGNGKSQWSGSFSTLSVAPSFGSHNATHDYVVHAELLMLVAERTGTGSLSWVEFEINQAPSLGETLTSELRLDIVGSFDSYAIDASFNRTALTFGKTIYTYTSPGSHDIGITNITTSKTTIEQGSTVEVNVTVFNYGTFTETFNLTAYANATTINTLTSLTLTSGNTTTITLTWNTTSVDLGQYIINAYASPVPGETDTTDNTHTNGIVTVKVFIHDIALTDTLLTKTVTGQGYPVSIAVFVENQGTFAETFNLTLYANTTLIASQNVTLPSGNSTFITFTWNTTGFAEYQSYVVSVYASAVANETDTADNTLTAGTVTIAYVGDINADGKIDILDIAIVSGASESNRINTPSDPRYGEYWHSTSCPYCPHNPNADIDENGVVDSQDMAGASPNFGWHL